MALAPAFQAVEEVEREAQAIADGGDEVFLDGQLVAQGRDLGPEQVEQDQEARARVLKLVDDLGLHVQRVGEDHGAARAQHAPVGDDGLGGVGQHDGHAVAALQAVLAQVGGQHGREPVQAAVREAQVLEDQGWPVGPALGGLLEQGVHGLRGRGEAVRHFRVVVGKPGSLYLGHEPTSWGGKCEGAWRRLLSIGAGRF
ncbi:MAG: hypothetical protein A2051_01330 [Desulfovibrionales bacterium GWA2_65_9]|nr:MAG: hypothetical protein A2051_01330 [Desulfovibrionales bacterium GWA2_65_9]